MLRIHRETIRETIALRLEGKLLEAWLPELDRALATADSPADPRHITLDLAGLDFADRAGAHFLARLRRQGAQLTNASAFVSGLLTLHDR